jgi:Ran GTPase-activating protein (RanGAP) involved in mRNA processing and transport
VLRGDGVDLTGLETVLLSDNSQITELEIDMLRGGDRHTMGFTEPENHLPILGLTHVLRALARHLTLTKLGLRRCPLGRNEARLLRVALCNMPSLHNLELANTDLGSAGLVELALALYHNTSIKVLDMPDNDLNDMRSARLLRDILRSNKTLTVLDLSGNDFEETTGAVECIADGLGSNSTLLKIDLSSCCLRDDDVSVLAQTLASRNTKLQKLTLGTDGVTSTGLGVLLETM